MLSLCAVLLLLGTGGAQSVPVEILTTPNAKVTEELGSGKLLPVVSADDRGRASWKPQPGAHMYVLEKTGCRAVRLRLEWLRQRGRWRYEWDGGRPMEVVPTHGFYLPRVFRLSVSPKPAEMVLLPKNVPLRPDAGGRWEVPWAESVQLQARRAAFAPETIKLDSAFMRGDAEAYPTSIYLQPLYGPFSYWQFNLLLFPLLGFAGWRAWRGRQKEKAVVEKAQEIVEAVADRPADQLPRMLGRVLHSMGGRQLTIKDELGSGAMGAVFRATDETGEVVAVKVLFRSTWEEPDFLPRFHREVGICSRLRHPGLLKVLDWGEYTPANEPRGYPFMVSELLTGKDLRAVLREKGILPWQEATLLISDTLHALREVHAAGIVHRDLKPENLMVTSRGRIKVLDFGIARELNAKSVTASATTIGTAHYMSPEHLDAKSVTPQSDLYSLGVIFYELLCGKPPYDAPDIMQIIMRMLRDEPQPLLQLCPELPPALAALVHKLLEKDPTRRYASAADVLTDLAPFISRPSLGDALLEQT